MIDDSNVLIEIDASPTRPNSPVVEAAASSDSETDSDDESRDAEGKTRRDRQAERAFTKLFLEFGGEKGFLDRTETIALVSSHYTATLQAERRDATSYVDKYFKTMCSLSSVEALGLDLEALQKWDASDGVVSLQLDRKRTKQTMTKEQLYQKQHQATYEEAQHVTQEMFARKYDQE